MVGVAPPQPAEVAAAVAALRPLVEAKALSTGNVTLKLPEPVRLASGALCERALVRRLHKEPSVCIYIYIYIYMYIISPPNNNPPHPPPL